MPIDDFFRWNQQQEREALLEASRLLPDDAILKLLAEREPAPRPIAEAMAYIHEQWQKDGADPKWGEAWHVLLSVVTG